MSPKSKALATVIAYVENKFADDIAAGWKAAYHGRKVVLIRTGAADGPAVREVELPPHLRPVAEAAEWHALHQSGWGTLSGFGRSSALPDLFAEAPVAQLGLF